ncbi:methyltransferase domain-containing protein [Sphingobium mellinum]|uniref:methyltransferase domain-containing protein n=1 Tax=Sphingobium mellinum TaxID=1387166 RepID=UPI0030ED54B6
MITLQRVAKAAGKHLTRAALAVRKALGARATRGCPACGQAVVGFFRYGDNAEWGCPNCGASPRERLMNHLIAGKVLTVPQQGAILHMAPNEASLVRRFSVAADYTPADLDPARYTVPNMRQVDLMALAETDRYDLFYASHVMEHVPDDHHVLRNIHRALKPGGEAWLIVPLWDRPTEDGSFDIPPRERERRFGQWDHVRQYGPDFADRIRAAGFDLEEVDASAIDPATRHHFALDDRLFRARKPAGPAAR